MAPVLERIQAFLKECLKKIKEVGNDYTIIGGDWNVVLDVNLDTCNLQENDKPPKIKK